MLAGQAPCTLKLVKLAVRSPTSMISKHSEAHWTLLPRGPRFLRENGVKAQRQDDPVRSKLDTR